MSMRPLAVRIEPAIVNYPTLCARLRPTSSSASTPCYAATPPSVTTLNKTAIEAGFLTVEEVRELEDLPRRAA